MDIKEAIIHARQVAEKCEAGNRDCGYQHDKLADWLEELLAYRALGTIDHLRELVQRDESAMTIEELLDFCAKREVEIYTRYDFFCDSIIIQMRKKNLKTEAAISRDMAACARFNLTVRRVLREMADELDKEISQ